ncbi:unnamed protein product, partial [Closterium sp. Naga37s-1]
ESRSPTTRHALLPHSSSGAPHSHLCAPLLLRVWLPRALHMPPLCRAILLHQLPKTAQ